MSLPSEVTSLLAGGAKKYEISRSLRFNSADSAYLSRTPASAGNRKTWTWSGWVKFGSLTETFPRLFSTGVDSDNRTEILFITNTNQIRFLSNVTGTSRGLIDTVAYLRDPSAWYHLVVSLDASSTTLTMYINGVQQTLTTSTAIANVDHMVNATNTHSIGRYWGAGNDFAGYMAEVHFIDGQALTPSSFGETDPVTGVWIPKRYTGTYGTNGFYLSFANNASTTTLGYDESGNNNDWTLNNFSVTAGAGNDSLEDTPTNNFCTLFNLAKPSGVTMSNGGLTVSVNGATPTVARACATFALNAAEGSWVWEFTPTSLGTAAGPGIIAADSVSTASTTISPGEWVYRQNGQKGNNGAYTAYGASFTTGDVIRLEFSGGTLTCFKNGTTQGALVTGLTGLWVPHVFSVLDTSAGDINFGQRPFAGTPTVGFNALNTQNLPKPLIAKPSNYFDAVTYTGTGASQNISGLDFSPDLVWFKARSAAYDHHLFDAVRGTNRSLRSNATGDETLYTDTLMSFDADGFTLGASATAGVNQASDSMVAWCWKENVTPGFDIVSYTGNGTARTISHSLGAVPHFMIVKARTTASTDQGWPVYHRNNTAAPETDYLLLNSTAATADLNTVWNDTAPTSSVFSVGTSALVNTNNDTYLAYLWTEIAGFSRFGTYTGNASTDGPFVWCGFRPAFLVAKDTSILGENWILYDKVRNTINPESSLLIPNLSNAESTYTFCDFLSNGFKIRQSGGGNTSGRIYIFAAFAENPFKYSLAR